MDNQMQEEKLPTVVISATRTSNWNSRIYPHPPPLPFIEHPQNRPRKESIDMSRKQQSASQQIDQSEHHARHGNECQDEDSVEVISQQVMHAAEDDEGDYDEDDANEEEEEHTDYNTGFAKIPGYEVVCSNEYVISELPSHYIQQTVVTDDPPKQEFQDCAELSEVECRTALCEYVGQHFCYGKGMAKEHRIISVQPTSALHLTVETFTETRMMCYHCEAYDGESLIDGPSNGRPPAPWDMECDPDDYFIDHEKHLEVPHTAQVQGCSRCSETGKVRCRPCKGRGTMKCKNCGGKGKKRIRTKGDYSEVRCSKCNGNGRRRCQQCNGHGEVKCKLCTGYGMLRWYILLTVKYTNKFADHIHKQTDVPEDLIREVSGDLIYDDTQTQVYPITCCAEEQINDQSAALIDQHLNSSKRERILYQRQRLYSVPVTETHYKWKKMKSRYWVYGTERHVYCPDYPQTCCFGCNIL